MKQIILSVLLAFYVIPVFSSEKYLESTADKGKAKQSMPECPGPEVFGLGSFIEGSVQVVLKDLEGVTIHKEEGRLTDKGFVLVKGVVACKEIVS